MARRIPEGPPARAVLLEDRAVAYVATHPGAGIRELMDALGLDASEVWAAVIDAGRSHRLEAHQHPETGAWRVYPADPWLGTR